MKDSYPHNETIAVIDTANELKVLANVIANTFARKRYALAALLDPYQTFETGDTEADSTEEPESANEPMLDYAVLYYPGWAGHPVGSRNAPRTFIIYGDNFYPTFEAATLRNIATGEIDAFRLQEAPETPELEPTIAIRDTMSELQGTYPLAALIVTSTCQLDATDNERVTHQAVVYHDEQLSAQIALHLLRSMITPDGFADTDNESLIESQPVTV